MADHIPITEMSFPTRVVAGPGSLQRLGEEVQRLGATRVLVVADHGVVRAKIVAQVEDALDEAGIARARYSGISANPEERDVLDGVWAYTSFNAQLVIGVGGGASLDVAKAICLKVTHPRPLEDYDDLKGGVVLIRNDMPPMIAIPTTSGTGSELGRASVIVLGKDKRKVIIFSQYMMPKVALLDATLTTTLPPHITAATGIDALTHALEAYVCKGSHPFAETFALSSLARIGNHLRDAVSDGNNLRARHEMQLAAAMAAIAFQKGLGACHSLAHPLSSVCGVHHGLANSLMLPHVMRYNLPAAHKGYAFAGRALGVRSGGGSRLLADACIDLVDTLIGDIGLPRRLRDAGVQKHQIDQMLPQAMADACHQLNPRPLTREAAGALYYEAF